jgi:fatty-acyl-CoA synthase
MRCAGGEKPTAADLKAFIRERRAAQKTPAYWIWLDQWPLTGSGKSQKFILGEGFAAGHYVAIKA